MSQGGDDNTRLGRLLVVLAAALVIAFVIGNAAGGKDGCNAEGKTIRGFECVEEEKVDD